MKNNKSHRNILLSALFTLCLSYTSPVMAETGYRYYTPAPTLRMVNDELPQIIQDRSAYGLIALANIDDSEALRNYYRSSNMRSLWPDPNNRDEIISVLENSWQEGLEPTDFHIDDIKRRIESGTARDLAEADILITASVLNYLAQMQTRNNGGTSANPSTFMMDLSDSGTLIDLPSLMANANPAQTLRDLGGTYGNVSIGLQEAMEQYRQIRTDGGWPQIPSGGILRAGDNDERTPIIRERLEITGDLAATGGSSETESPYVFDNNLVAALMHFQARNGLNADGALGPITLAALNQTVDQRIAQIALNMERWRSLSIEDNDRYILVNIPAFEMTVMEGDKAVLNMRAIVGRPDRETPIVESRLDYMVVNPDWRIPPTIVAEHILPNLKNDGNWLNEQGIEVYSDWSADAVKLDPTKIDWSIYDRHNVPFMFRQPPGSANPLGHIKFMFRNNYSVYMHDTPHRGLFERETRTFSSGCVRLEHPDQLANYLLQSRTDWNSDSLEDSVSTGTTETIGLNSSERIPLYIAYLTAWTDQSGNVQFRRDIYGQDQTLIEEQIALSSPETQNFNIIDQIPVTPNQTPITP